MSRLERTQIIVSFFLLLACILGISHISKANENGHAHEENKVLLLGLELKDLAPEERSRFAHYTILERPYLSGNLAQELVQQVKPEAVLIRQPSGGIYEYTANGSLVKQVDMQDSRQRMLSEQQNKSVNLPNFINSGMSPMAGQSFPVQITGQMQIGGQVNNMQMQMRPNSMPIKYAMPNWQNSHNQQSVYPNLQNTQNMQRPFPGANVPLYLYPNTSEYSYLPGEGEFLPPPALSAFRQAIKQTSTLAQNTAYPFWFDSYLTTDSSTLNNFGSTSSGSVAGFPTLQFNANTTANGAVVASQWLGTGIGLGATLLDSALEGASLRSRRESAYRDSLGTAYYQYPQYARTSYPAMPNQPLPTSPWY